MIDILLLQDLIEEKIAHLESAVQRQNEKLLEIENSMFVNLEGSSLSCPDYYESVR